MVFDLPAQLAVSYSTLECFEIWKLQLARVFEPLKTVPFYLRPSYFESLFSYVYHRVKRATLGKMDESVFFPLISVFRFFDSATHREEKTKVKVLTRS